MSSPTFPLTSGGGSGTGTNDHTQLTNRTSANQHPGSSVSLVTTNFDGNLSSADDTVQKAMETIDEMTASGTGDVTGPASTTENYIPQWDSTTKKLKDGKAIGTTSGTIAAGDDSRFTDSRSPNITGLTAETSIADDDLVPIYDTSASANRKMTKANFVAGLSGGSTDHWILESGSFTATPASTSTLTMTSDRTAAIKAGYGVRYTIGGTAYYGVITAMASNLMTIAGASLSGDVTALAYTKTGIIQMPILIPGYYEDATSAALLAEDLGQTLIWQQGPAYMVRALMYSRVVDSSSDGYANVRQGAAIATGTAQSGDGTHITLAAGASASDDYYNNMWIKITGGTGTGQSRKITDYVGETKIAAVATWVANPSSNSTYEIYNPVINSNTYSGLLIDSTAAKETVIDIDTAEYGIAYGDSISVMALKGTGGTAQDLSVMLTYVVA